MGDEKNAREWWIKIPSAGDFRYWDSDISTDPHCMETEGDFVNAVHVIEKSAFDTVCKERDELRSENERLKNELQEAIGKAWHPGPDSIAAHHRLAIEECKALREEVERLKNQLATDLSDNEDYVWSGKFIQVCKERDQLRAENERLKSDRENFVNILPDGTVESVFQDKELAELRTDLAKEREINKVLGDALKELLPTLISRTQIERARQALAQVEKMRSEKC